ncbi:MAG TPA: hypothetical protein GX015_03440 [Corynebacterium sp.]|uniref:hypothetical protein n=1 Tax=Corynebacterium sp. TaxID=1720 RepID=UPI00185A73CD|nr:hypothetical protein [Corynebacterium sp.]HHT31588.1 hypothetical protein [Corynebacterium sp.]
MNDLRNRAINWVLVEKPVTAAKVIRRLTASGSKGAKGAKGKRGSKGVIGAAAPALPARSAAPAPLTRDNGLRAANIAAGVPGAE